MTTPVSPLGPARTLQTVGITLLLLLVAGQHILAQSNSPTHTFEDAAANDYDLFGDSVAIEGGNVLIGVSGYDNSQTTNVGQARLFDATTGSRLGTLDNPANANNEFGESIAIDSDTALVGAWGDDTDGTDAGRAYLFDTKTGDRLHTLNDPTPASYDKFGISVDIDGNYALVGASFHDTPETDIGQAHLFNATSGKLVRTWDDPNPTTRDKFGQAVAIDGNRALVGSTGHDAQNTDTGQAHLFDTEADGALRNFNDPSPTGYDRFGASVDIDADKVLVGAPGDDSYGDNVGQAHLFDATTGKMLETFDDPTPTGDDQFGISVAIDGNSVLIGAGMDNSQGSGVGQAHLFDAVTGDLLQTFDDPNATTSDQFGASVDIDGQNLLVGASLDDTNGPNTGQAHLFTESVSMPTPGALPAGLTLLGLMSLVRSRRR